ncbi:hypothetical protein C8Q70DRAFT_1126763, partial [Cubamyces menziesii]
MLSLGLLSPSPGSLSSSEPDAARTQPLSDPMRSRPGAMDKVHVLSACMMPTTLPLFLPSTPNLSRPLHPRLPPIPLPFRHHAFSTYTTRSSSIPSALPR